METEFRSGSRFTQEEFRDWLAGRPAADINHYELLHGQIVMSPPAGWRHGSIGSRLSQRIGRHVESRRLGRVFDSSTGYELPSGDTLEPDFSFVSADRWSTLPHPPPDGFLRIAPTLVVEVLSRSTAKLDRTEKKEIYARNGVEEYWLVDVERREVTLFFREDDTFSEPRIIASGRIPSRVLSSLEAQVEELFADLT